MKRFVALCAVLASALSVYGQSERGNISGLITDPTGAAVAAAELTAVNTATNATSRTATSSSGEFNIPNLVPGSYRLEVVATGFKRYVQQNVVVAAASTIRLDMALQLGQVSEQIEVSAAAAVIQTDNAKVSTQVQNKMVDELPLVVGGTLRSPFNLVAVVPEARGDGQGLAIGGGQRAQWDATLDGHSVGTNRSGDTAEAALNTPSVEALTEFTVDTNGFKAEYGQAGGGVMTFASKSGTNSFHGNVYDFLRNDKLDARGFFASSRSVYRQNDFGVTASGPLYIPKIYDGRNKTFWFVAFEGFRNRVGANATILNVPTPEMYSGDFRQWVDQNNRVVPIYDPRSQRANPSGAGFVRDLYPNNMIPVSQFSTTANAIAQYGKAVQPNRGGVPGTSNYVRQNYIVTGGTMVTPTDKWSVKGDQMFGSNHRASLLWNTTIYRGEPGPAGAPGLPEPLWNGQIQAWDTEAFRVSEDWTISPNMVNHFSFAKNNFAKNSYSANVDKNWKDKVCIKNAVDCNQNFPGIEFSEFTSWGATSYNGTYQPGWGLKNDLSYIRGSHSLKFGFQYQDQNADGFGQQDLAGRAGFDFRSTSVPGAASFIAGGGSSFASFLIGDAYTGRTETIRVVTQKFRYFGGYAQDDWRVTRKLTVNFGLRYDVTLPPTNKKDEYSDFNPARPNPGADNLPGALWFAGFGPGRENSRSLVPGWYGGWGPRIGIAFTPDTKTTFRTAFGRSFSRVTAVQGSGHFAGFIGQYPFANTSQGVTPTFRLDEGLPAYRLPPSIDPAFSNGNQVDYWQGQEATRAPESLFWTFNIQRQVAQNMVVELGYNASIGTHLQTGLLTLNQLPTATYHDMVSRFGVTQAQALLRGGITTAAVANDGYRTPYAHFTRDFSAPTLGQALRPYPMYQNINTDVQNGDKSGHSSYHAFVVKMDRRFSKGLTMNWSYVLSKMMTDSDTYFANAAGAMDHYNRGLEKSLAAFDQTHTLKFATIYDLPFGKGQRWMTDGILNQVLGGWRIAAIQVYNSGTPVALSRNNPLPIFNEQTRPYVTSYDDWRAPVGSGGFDPGRDRFLKSRAEFPVQPNDFGNVTRFNPKVRTFPGMNENISLAKTFRVGEIIRVDLRGEAFNLFNRTIFGTGATSLDSAALGVVTNQGNTPRQMQVGLKVYW